MHKLAIVTTHPIQYYAPLFRLLAQQEQLKIKVFYTWSQRQNEFFDYNFGKSIEWDIPLLEGYEFTFVQNTSKSPSNQFFRGIKCPALVKEIKEWKATYILIFGWNFHAHLNAIRHFKGKIPVWFRGDSHLLDEKPGIKKFLRRIFLTWVYSHIDKAYFVGTNNKKYYLKHGLKEAQLTFAPHAIDNERFSNPHDVYDQKASEWRQQLEIKDDDFTILFCGKLESKKDPFLLLDAFLALQNQGLKNLKLIFTGTGELESSLKKKAKKDQDIHFLPFQNQSKMPIVYRLANVYCLPSQGPGETWGLAVNEALACGIPVLVSDKVGCAIDLVNEKTGVIFKNNNKKSLIEGIKKIHLRYYNPEVIKDHVSNWSFQSIIKAIIGQIR
ncbi:MAG: glycosyltransferase [Candidatus Thermoplasmatota archaeon]|nr:glycosyltransferase [Candidatus Thermoplasmatota archaeon]